MLNKTIHFIDLITEKVGKSVSLLNILMVLTMCLVVGLRYLFNNSSIMLQESVMYLHAIIFLACMGFTFKHDEHVRVDILYNKMPVKVKAIVNLLGTLLLMLPVLGFIFWYSLDYIGNAWAIKEVSQEAAGLPYVYLLKSLIIVMTVLLGLQGINEVLRCYRTIVNPDSPGQDNPPSNQFDQDSIHG